MGKRSKIILPIAIFFAGLAAVLVGRQSQVSADIYSQTGTSTIYLFLMAAGFLLIAVAAIITLFIIASGEKR